METQTPQGGKRKPLRNHFFKSSIHRFYKLTKKVMGSPMCRFCIIYLFWGAFEDIRFELFDNWSTFKSPYISDYLSQRPFLRLNIFQKIAFINSCFISPLSPSVSLAKTASSSSSYSFIQGWETP